MKSEAKVDKKIRSFR